MTIVPGAVIEYSLVRAALAELFEKFRILSFRYDAMYAADTAQWVVEKYPDCEVVKFPQNIMAFAGPTAEYERLVLGGQLQHNKNGLLTWQAGHCKVWTDTNRNKRPVKPKAGDIRGVDGIVAGVMALSGAWAPPEPPSAYEPGGADEDTVFCVEDLMEEEREQGRKGESEPSADAADSAGAVATDLAADERSGNGVSGEDAGGEAPAQNASPAGEAGPRSGSGSADLESGGGRAGNAFGRPEDRVYSRRVPPRDSPRPGRRGDPAFRRRSLGSLLRRLGRAPAAGRTVRSMNMIAIDPVETSRARRRLAGNCLVLLGLASLVWAGCWVHPALGLLAGGLAAILLAVIVRPDADEEGR